MFKLEHAIKQWRHELLGDNKLSIDNVDELESHLRDDIDIFLLNHKPQKAFELAVTKLGEKQLLIKEYKKISNLYPIDRKILNIFYSLFLVLPIIAVTAIWLYMEGGPRFYYQMSSVMSAVGYFCNFSFILMLSVLSVYAIFSIRGSAYRNAAFFIPVRKATAFTLLTCLVFYFTSILPIFLSSNYPLQDHPGALFRIFGTLPLILAATFARSRMVKSNTLVLARLNIFLGIFIFSAMFMLQQQIGGTRLVFKLILISIVTLFIGCLAYSYLPRYRQVT